MQRQRQFDDAQIGAEVTAVLSARVDEDGANLAGQNVDLRPRESLQITGRVDALKNHERRS